MGYCITLEEGDIKIKKKNMPLLLKELSNYFSNGGKFRWVNGFQIDEADVISFEFIEGVWDDLRYEIKETDTHYEIVDFIGEKLGDDLEIFKLISKFCEDGYLQFLGEDGDHFRIIIKNKKAYEKFAEICW